MNRATQIRIDRGLKVIDVCKHAGIGPKTLKKIEEGEPVNAGSLARLANYYEVPASTLNLRAVFPDLTEEPVA
jgi:transcriptional regulator with XRE-family HTH domain